MAKIIVEGNEATVTVVEISADEGVYGLQCDKGAWCPRADEIREYRSTHLADTVVEADRHSDFIMHA